MFQLNRENNFPMNKKFFIAIILILILGIFGGSLWFYFSWRSGSVQKYAVNKIIDSETQNNSTWQNSGEFLRKVLGFENPRYYLLLFLNNTELRPGGGFIGSYGVLKIENGIPQILKVEGTESLDLNSTSTIITLPPKPLTDYLKINNWQFRDSNWSPDFASSCQKSLELYKKENGLDADKIDGVIGITPTVFEGLLEITGPVNINGEEYNSKNFTEKLEYEVEYGYREDGKEFGQRKGIMSELGTVILSNFKKSLFTDWEKYFTLFKKMTNEKQVLFYLNSPEEQRFIVNKNFGGEVKDYEGDYLLFVDANLGAWKTDVTLDRNLSYIIKPTESGKLMAEVKMIYRHESKVNWRISRYLSYSRLYVPKGSQLIEVSAKEKNSKLEILKTNSGEDFGKEWFGVILRVEPLTEKELSFKFYLSPEIESQIRFGNYNLYFQKQLGTLNHGLTLDLDFGKKVISAIPSEDKKNWGDNNYNIKTDLSLDREFKVKLNP